MPVLKKKKETLVKKSDLDQIRESSEDDSPESGMLFELNKGDFGKVISTGSTQLDLAISGKKVRGGGIPGGILLEIYGPSGGGKTGLLSEMCGSTQIRGGEVKSADPEARLDQEYIKYYGVSIKEDIFDYCRPDTVEEIFDLIFNWRPKNPDVINLFAGDSVAALSTNLEMTEGDKMGMKRAKDFSAGLRKTCRIIAKHNWIVAFTNQIRQDTSGHNVTPGGLGIPFYASVRIQVVPSFQAHKIEKEITLGSGVKVKSVIGVKSICTITKSSVDEPYRQAPISIIFNTGVDDVRDNLQYYKDMTKESKFNVITKEFLSMEKAIQYAEAEDLEKQIRERTIDLWLEIQEKFNVHRKIKVRI